MSQLRQPRREDHVTVSQALSTLPISRSTLYRLIKGGRVEAKRFGHTWRLSAVGVAEIAANGVPSSSAVA